MKCVLSLIFLVAIATFSFSQKKGKKLPCLEFQSISNLSPEEKLLSQYCAEGNLEKVKMLFAKGARLNSLISGLDDISPLQNAIGSYNYDLVKFLLDNGALPCMPYCYANDADAEVFYHISLSFYPIVSNSSDYKILEKKLIYADRILTLALQKGYKISEWDKDNHLLYLLTTYKSEGLFKLYDRWTKLGVKYNLSTTLDFFYHKIQPFNIKDTSIVKRLIKLGYNINTDRYNYSDGSGVKTTLPILYLAVKSNDVPLINFLLKNGANAAYVNTNYNHEPAWCSPLTYAVHLGHLEAAKALADHGALIRSNNCVSRKHLSPVDYALQVGRRDIAEYLITK